MFTDESHIISCFIDRYSHIVLTEKIVFLTSCALKMDLTDLHFIFNERIF